MSGSSFFPRPLCHSRHGGRSKNPREHNTRAGYKYEASSLKDTDLILVRRSLRCDFKIPACIDFGFSQV